MPLTAGIVGLPNVGKSTLFNAITNSQVEAANYPFATINPNTGTVKVNDKRVDELTKMFNSLKTIYATFEFTDIAGLVKGASKGEGLGNKFLANIREVDAICHVVRCFDDPEILHVEGSVDPVRDVETVNIELIFADLETVNKRIEKVEKKAIVTKDKEAVKEYNVLKPIKEALEKGLPARSVELSKEEALIVKGFNLLTMKPTIYIANVSLEDLSNENINDYYQALKDLAIKEGAKIVPICAKIEAELSSLDKEEKDAFLEEIGAKESGLDRIIFEAYSLLGLKTFFTTGSDETRAWTFKDGMSAPECAGIIHTDFYNKFIKAEVYTYDDLIKYGSEQALKEKGLIRIEGKDYLMKDGDIVFIRHG
ncbi:MAG: redox-regulated ATPase YchF [Bacilli bacterium]|nr:redox-regulated ATPase YchF [Bacilli bacterium]